MKRFVPSTLSRLQGLPRRMTRTTLLLAAMGIGSAYAAEATPIDYTAGIASGSDSSTSGSGNGSADADITSVTSSFDLTGGTPHGGVDFGTFTATGHEGSGVIGATYSLDFNLSRTITFTVNNTFTTNVTEVLAVHVFGDREGGFGQYDTYTATLDPYSTTYDLGSYGTLDAQFDGGTITYDGLSAPGPIGVTGTFTLHPVPEASSVVLMSLGTLGGGAVCLRSRKRGTRKAASV